MIPALLLLAQAADPISAAIATMTPEQKAAQLQSRAAGKKRGLLSAAFSRPVPSCPCGGAARGVFCILKGEQNHGIEIHLPRLWDTFRL